jgi:hypothetical protein
MLYFQLGTWFCTKQLSAISCSQSQKSTSELCRNKKYAFILLRQQRNNTFVARVLVRNTASFSASSTKPLVIISVCGCVRAFVGEHAFMNGKIGIYRSLALQHPFAGGRKKTGFPTNPRHTPMYTLNARKHTPRVWQQHSGGGGGATRALIC